MRRFFVILIAFTVAVGIRANAQKPRAKPAEPALQTAPSRPMLSEAMLKALSARSIGPAVMGGRISDIALDPQNPAVFYVATAHGGLMKTTDNGGSFTDVTEKEAVASFGAVAVAPSDPKVIWAGTGEANDRNSSGWGRGVLRSTDGGSTWTNAGLKDSRTIARIVVHPANPDTAYVAAMGDLWTPGGERGLFKTTDRGKTWKAVLQGPAPDTDKVGCGDVAIDPRNPETIFAVLYARRRTPWSFMAGPDATAGRDAGGIFRSTNGGTSWKKLTTGLPGGTGRIGLAVFPKNPRIVYAVVQSDEAGTSNIDDVTSKRGGVFRSDDGGDTWHRQSNLAPRPFYFSQIRVDPENDRHVYVLGFMLHVSEDGGQSWREDRFKNVHSDCHALAIDPRNPRRALLGTDGGVYQTYNEGERWTHVNTMAIGEFYRISVDNSVPYRICGGLQDNLNWVGPSATRTKDGIVNSDWLNITGGDGFYCVFDADDPDVIYSESQSGSAFRFNLSSGAVKTLRPEPAEGQTAFRFHWNSPFIRSLHEKGRMYLAGNRVFALTDHGETWKAMSPDLSAQQAERIMTTGSGAETYGVVFALAESPAKAGLLWAGTDDGKLWVTEDEGAHWADLTASLPAPAKGQWIARVEPGWTDARSAYLVVSAYRSGNYAPLIYHTTDLGKSWRSVAVNLPVDSPARVVREDPENENLLFAGTESGLYASLDRGASWIPFGNLAGVPVDDIAVHQPEHDLVIATHGRSIFIVDDIRPLELLTTGIAVQAAHLFPVSPATGFEPLPGWTDSAGSAMFRGANPPAGAIINVYVKEFTGDQISVAIAAVGGRPVANLTSPGVPGLTRIVWDLKPTKDLLNEYGGQGQKFVRPGEYEVTLTFGKLTQKERVKVDIAKGLETR